ncbi:PREDICTED: uncharacterized protein LOC107329010 isoform X2 [Acropora digitifera]|uniref:uncharacterized protein LOC107329010 isoform X2 n=1 Tax=Acropora digitifera TaxID=70779 RepID=UPI00077AEF00|nr:PREDICTED: uncharacterized protein LOC107329010 isoform X2 [Acropora digitifera]
MSQPSNCSETRRYLEQLAAGDNPPDAVFMQSVFSDDVSEIDPPAINNFPVQTRSMESSTAKGYKGSPFYGSGLKGKCTSRALLRSHNRFDDKKFLKIVFQQNIMT